MGQTTDARQLLGMKKAASGRNIWVIRLQLMKPITWVPLIWGVLCGVTASGHFQWRWDNLVAALLCMVLSGPLLTGFTQTINDFYDRDIDAINEPYRPIPSGAISLVQVRIQIIVLLVAGLAMAWGLDRWVGHTTPILFFLALGGSLVSILYSAPPIKLKRSCWTGNYALGASYIALPWWAGQALFGHLSWFIIGLTLVYSLAGLGIAVVNDFKSMAGDRQLGIQSLPALLGPQAASWVSAALIDGFQVLIALVLMALGQHLAGTVLVLLVIPQMVLQDMWLLRDPLRFDVQYQLSAQPFLVLGMLVSAMALGQSTLALA